MKKMKKVWFILIAVTFLLVGIILHFTHSGMFSAGDYAFNYFAAGDFAVGVFAAGKFSAGIFSIGIFSVGIFSASIFNLALYSTGIFVIAYKKKLPKLLNQNSAEEKTERN